ncbi:multicellular organismal development [Nesidiocoris tenuis]|uniref:Multicellular organismal development n=1 Tax=Nesidiocoris tenuis TaxID=355587 RepID=A0ABN7AUL1_9HEMI|nr:multicellular organismal development [Nesidiocoris tenuis]
MVERFNRTLVDLLSKTVGENQKDWDKQLPIALLAYRATEHSSTGFSPAMLLYGRELALPVNLLRGRLPQESEVTDYARELQDRLSRVHESAQEKLLNAAENVKRRYIARGGPQLFIEGQDVWCFYPKRKVGLSPKLQSPWTGPCKIIRKISDVVYRIKLPTGRTFNVHADRLVPVEEEGEK